MVLCFRHTLSLDLLALSRKKRGAKRRLSRFIDSHTHVLSPQTPTSILPPLQCGHCSSGHLRGLALHIHTSLWRCSVNVDVEHCTELVHLGEDIVTDILLPSSPSLTRYNNKSVNTLSRTHHTQTEAIHMRTTHTHTAGSNMFCRTRQDDVVPGPLCCCIPGTVSPDRRRDEAT